jgi:hypothetical protein
MARFVLILRFFTGTIKMCTQTVAKPYGGCYSTVCVHIFMAPVKMCTQVYGAVKNVYPVHKMRVHTSLKCVPGTHFLRCLADRKCVSGTLSENPIPNYLFEGRRFKYSLAC